MLRAGIVRQALHGMDAARICQRSHVAGGIQSIAHFELACVLQKLRYEVAVHTLLHQKPGGRHADLTGIAKLTGHHGLGSQSDVGIVEHNHRRVTAQFHGHALHVQTGH